MIYSQILPFSISFFFFFSICDNSQQEMKQEKKKRRSYRTVKRIAIYDHK